MILLKIPSLSLQNGKVFSWNSTETKQKKSSRSEVLCEKGVLRNFTKCTGKHLCQSFIKPTTLLQKRNSFPCGFGHIYWRNPNWKTLFSLQWFKLDAGMVGRGVMRVWCAIFIVVWMIRSGMLKTRFWTGDSFLSFFHYSYLHLNFLAYVHKYNTNLHRLN